MRTRGWRKVAHEWNVIPRDDAQGRGDLVFQKNDTYCVIECKRRMGAKVEEQARFYAAAWKLKYAEEGFHVLYGIWTCKRKRILGVISNRGEAYELCVRPACRLL
jgi:hypothetical protein